jgi:hypothetical protein
MLPLPDGETQCTLHWKAQRESVQGELLGRGRPPRSELGLVFPEQPCGVEQRVELGIWADAEDRLPAFWAEL